MPMLSQLCPNGEFSLGLSMPVKSHKIPQPSASRQRGGKPQTTHSKRMVRNGVWRLECLHGKRNLAFVTYTIPNLPEADMAHLRAEWAEVVKQLVQSIKRDLERAGIRPEVVHVVEIQDERYRKTGVIAPHIHAVFQSRKTRYSPYAISTERNTKLWNRALSNVLGRPVEAPYGANIQPIKKSVERYLSKYMSKGGAFVQELIDAGKRDELPKQWWGVTKSLKQWVLDNCQLLSEEFKEFVRDNYKQFLDKPKECPFSWLYVHTIKLLEPHGEEIEFPVAIVGKVRPNWMSAIMTCTAEDLPGAVQWSQCRNVGNADI